VSETQRYKFGQEFTLPSGGFDIARALFTERLEEISAVMDDPGAEDVFTKDEWAQMGFERLMLAQMVARMNKGGSNA
jgi:hypothetical protein